MSTRLTEITRRRGRLPALVTALAVAGWLVAVQLVGVLLNLGTVIQQEISGPGYAITAPYIGAVLGELAFRALPMALGVFVSLWAIAPISPDLGLRYVLTRGALAALAGTVLTLLVGIVVSFFTAFSGPGSLFGSSFPFSSFDGGHFVSLLLGTLIGAITGFLAVLPLVLLAVVLLWLWLKEHPREYEVSGLIDDI